jgi:23S rRNA (cytidine1920-2'-O)/16S rRNA (cytidine1409-2'-O)-methyltransferase
VQKVRLDLLLVERGLAESRSKSQAIIMAGQVRVDGQVVIKPATAVPGDSQVDMDAGPRYVSRGGEKLEHALIRFALPVKDLVCADVGSSTGGFSDCLIQHGAAKVYAIDVGKGILHWKIRTDPRVVVMEETNARFLEFLPEAVDLVTIDASFISLKILLPVVKKWLTPSNSQTADQISGTIIALIKPQFEAGRKETANGRGVIRDPNVHRVVLNDILSYAKNEGFRIRGLIKSPLTGPKGNIEFLAWFEVEEGKGEELATLIDGAMQ